LSAFVPLCCLSAVEDPQPRTRRTYWPFLHYICTDFRSLVAYTTVWDKYFFRKTFVHAVVYRYHSPPANSLDSNLRTAACGCPPFPRPRRPNPDLAPVSLTRRIICLHRKPSIPADP